MTTQHESKRAMKTVATTKRDVNQFKYGNLHGLKALVKREVLRFLTVYLQTIIAPTVTTLLFYIIFALAFGGVERSVSGVPFLHFLAPGLIMMAMVQNAFANTSSSWMIAKIQGNITDILMPPLSPFELFLGNAIGAIARGLIVGLCCFAILMLYAPMPAGNIGLMIAFALLGTLMLGSIGVMAGLWSERFDHVAAVTNFVITPLAFLSGTFYSMDSLPELWRFIASFNPFYYMIDGFRQGMIGVGDTDIVTGLTVLGVINLLLALAVVTMLRSGYKIKA